jgi:hypothetical protein
MVHAANELNANVIDQNANTLNLYLILTLMIARSDDIPGALFSACTHRLKAAPRG